MPPSSANRRELDTVLPDNISTELSLWKQLIFDTDMPPRQEKRNDDPGHDPNRSQVPPPYFQAPPQLPPETYTHLIHALISMQGSAHPHGYPPAPSYPPLQNYNPPWPPNAASPISSAPIAGPSSFYPTNPPVPLPPLAVPQIASSSQLTHSPVASSATASTLQDPEGAEDAVSIDDDKRRRNTAASARFRVKKKLKTLNLERTVADLTGRTEDLEREANDLRRENAWLKEIVLLKGRNLALNRGTQGPAPGDRHDEDEEPGDRTQDGSEKAKGGKGKEKQN